MAKYEHSYAVAIRNNITYVFLFIWAQSNCSFVNYNLKGQYMSSTNVSYINFVFNFSSIHQGAYKVSAQSRRAIYSHTQVMSGPLGRSIRSTSSNGKEGWQHVSTPIWVHASLNSYTSQNQWMQKTDSAIGEQLPKIMNLVSNITFSVRWFENVVLLGPMYLVFKLCFDRLRIPLIFQVP